MPMIAQPRIRAGAAESTSLNSVRHPLAFVRSPLHVYRGGRGAIPAQVLAGARDCESATSRSHFQCAPLILAMSHCWLVLASALSALAHGMGIGQLAKLVRFACCRSSWWGSIVVRSVRLRTRSRQSGKRAATKFKCCASCRRPANCLHCGFGPIRNRQLRPLATCLAVQNSSAAAAKSDWQHSASALLLDFTRPDKCRSRREMTDELVNQKRAEAIKKLEEKLFQVRSTMRSASDDADSLPAATPLTI